MSVSSLALFHRRSSRHTSFIAAASAPPVIMLSCLVSENDIWLLLCCLPCRVRPQNGRSRLRNPSSLPPSLSLSLSLSVCLSLPFHSFFLSKQLFSRFVFWPTPPNERGRERGGGGQFRFFLPSFLAPCLRLKEKRGRTRTDHRSRMMQRIKFYVRRRRRRPLFEEGK